MAFRFIHIADVHLDTPFQNREAGLRAFLRDAVRQALQGVMDLALAKGVDALLIAGDLFDNATLSFATERFLLEQLNRLWEAGIKVYYAPGNHDPYGGSYRLSQVPWPANVHIFNTRQPTTCPVVNASGKTIAYISGAGHEDHKEGENLARDFPRAQDGTIHVGLLHAFVSGSQGDSQHERYAPCISADLEEKNYTYWALGHIHARSEISGRFTAVYPGCLVGRNPGEEGPKGGYLVEIDDSGRVRKTFLSLAPVYWSVLRVAALSAAGNLEDLKQRIMAGIVDHLQGHGLPDPGRIFLRVVLEGPSALYQELQEEENTSVLEEELQRALKLRHLEVVTDNVVRAIDPGSYRGEPHVLSTALQLLEALQKDDDLLLKLAPPTLAGCSNGSDRSAKLSYLRGLLQGLDYEAAARLVEVERG